MQTNKFNINGWLICALGALFYCYEYLLRIEPSVMVNNLMLQLGITAASFGLITALYYYAYTPMQLLVGILLDRYGTRLALGLAVIACTIGSWLFSIAHSVYLAGIARFLIGLGSSFAFVGVLKLAADWLPLKHFALFAGLTTSLGMVGGMIGDIGLTALTNQIGWQHTQNIGTLIGIILTPLIFIFVHNKTKRNIVTRPEAFQIEERHKRNQAEERTPTYVSNEEGRQNISLGETISAVKKVIINPQMWICGLVGCIYYLSLSAFAELWGIKFLQNIYALTAKQAAFACSMIFIGWLIGGPFNGWLSDQIKSRRKLLIWGGVLSLICFLIILLKPITVPYSVLCGLLLLFGFFSSAQILCFAISKESNPHHLAASSVAFTNFLIMIGGMVFQPLIGFLLDFGWSNQFAEGVRAYSMVDFKIALAVIPVSIAVGIFLSTKLKV